MQISHKYESFPIPELRTKSIHELKQWDLNEFWNNFPYFQDFSRKMELDKNFKMLLSRNETRLLLR